jgi:hypothetical protein
MFVLDGGSAEERAEAQHQYGPGGGDCWQCHRLRGYGVGGEGEAGEV